MDEQQYDRKEALSRTEALIGSRALDVLEQSVVAVFGLGGVGGHAAEALARSGVGSFVLVDSDRVAMSNLNRQMVATLSTVGEYKTDVMRRRILEINPRARVEVRRCFFLPETASEFDFSGYSYVVDAVDTVTAKLELVMNQAGVTPEICPAVSASLLKAEATGAPAGAMVLPDGRVVTGRTSDTLGAASALLLNALKAMGGIDDHFELISSQVLEPVCRLKTEYLGHKNPRLHTDEVLMALTISALTNPLAELAQQQLPKLRGCDAHFSVILSEVDESLLKRLGINVSCEARYETKKLYHK